MEEGVDLQRGVSRPQASQPSYLIDFRRQMKIFRSKAVDEVETEADAFPIFTEYPPAT